MDPANQGLESVQFPGRQLHDGLVVQDEVPVLDGLVEFVLQPVAGGEEVAVPGLEPRHLARHVRPRARKRRASVLQALLGARLRVPVHGESGGGGGVDDLPFHGHGLRQFLQHVLQEASGLVGVGDRIQQDGEFVGGQATDRVTRSQAGLEPGGDQRQQRFVEVRRVALGDGGPAVQGERADREAPLAFLQAPPLEAVQEQGLGGESGGIVEHRPAQELLLDALALDDVRHQRAEQGRELLPGDVDGRARPCRVVEEDADGTPERPDGGQRQPAASDHAALAVLRGHQGGVFQDQPPGSLLVDLLRLFFGLSLGVGVLSFVRGGSCEVRSPGSAQHRARLVFQIDGYPLESDGVAGDLDGSTQQRVHVGRAHQFFRGCEHGHEIRGAVLGAVGELPGLSQRPVHVTNRRVCLCSRHHTPQV